MMSQSEKLVVEPELRGWSSPVRTSIDESYNVICQIDALSPQNLTLSNVLSADHPVLLVTTPSVERFYGDRVRQYFAANTRRGGVHFMVLSCSETRKSTEQMLAVCARAAEAGLARRSSIVCVGGGVSLDITGLAATLFRRGIPHVRVPTTLIGMTDAGIGVKNAVNYGAAKSLLGTFTAPEACIIDPTFLATLPRRHLRCGMAEILKIAVMCSAELFALVESSANHLLEGAYGMPLDIAEELIRLSVRWTLHELQLNLFERKELFEATSYARKLDFAHTFSPHVEMVSRHRFLHGEAVAIDMAVSTELAHKLGILDDVSKARLLKTLRRLGLPVYWNAMDAAAMHASLKSIVKHRDGQLNLVLPAGIGRAAFLKDLSEVSVGLLGEVLQRLARWDEGEADG
jgi:3-dehydroquinate synthetase